MYSSRRPVKQSLCIAFAQLQVILAISLVTFCLAAMLPLSDSLARRGAFVVYAQSSSEAAKSSVGHSSVLSLSERSQIVRMPRFGGRLVIDGRLNDESWRQAAIIKDFYQIQPGDNSPPSKPTEVFLGYDQHFLYIAFYAYDDPGKVRATVAKRDDISDDDNVSVLLDTFNDRRRAYKLSFNPLGVQADGILMEGRGEDRNVDILMESKGALMEDGYCVEVAIPFKSLHYEAGEGKLWGVHFFRVIKRLNNEENSWMPISRDQSGLLSQEGHITGLYGISTERTLEIIPTLTLLERGKRVRSLSPAELSNNPLLKDPGRFVNEPVDIDPGLTVKLGITPTITLDATFNPDFAEVEADQSLVRANQRFPIFFPEKRPFFLEGIEMFQTPLQAVHTRAIISPDYAMKLAGKHGRNTFGILMASDKAPGDFSPEERLNASNFRFLDKNAYIGILRFKRDIGKESNIGMIATSYNLIEKHNQLGGFDGRVRLNSQTTFTFQALGTTSRRFFFDPNLGQDIYRTGNGFGYYWNYDRSGRHVVYQLKGEGRTRDFRADVGFTRRTNTNSKTFYVGYFSTPKPKAKLTSWYLSNTARIGFDWQGRMQDSKVYPEIGFYLRRDTYFKIGFNNGYERLFEEEFGPKRTPTRAGTFLGDDSERSTHEKSINISGGTTPNKKYSAYLFVGRTWNGFDFDFGAGPRFPRVSPAALRDPDAPLNPGPGNLWDITATFTYKMTAALRTSFDYTKSRLVRKDTGRVAYDDNIYSLRALYHFNRFTFTRARIDYDSLTSQVFSEFLGGWTPHPGTSIYFGYNDHLHYNGFSPFTGQRERGFHRSGRTFFVKMSYLFRRSL